MGVVAVNSFKLNVLDGHVAKHTPVPPGVIGIIDKQAKQREHAKACYIDLFIHYGKALRQIKELQSEIRAMKREADAATGIMFKNQTDVRN